MELCSGKMLFHFKFFGFFFSCLYCVHFMVHSMFSIGVSSVSLIRDHEVDKCILDVFALCPD